MTLTTTAAKHIRRRIEGKSPEDAVRDLLADCADVKERMRAAATRMKAIQKPKAPGKDRDERREEHNASTLDLRSKAWIRCGGTIRVATDESGTDVTLYEGAGRCEVSGVELGAAWELHHLDGGGNRRSRQSLDNCLAVSWEAHRLIHRGDLATLRSVKEACIRIGMRDGLRAIEHRLAKVMEARP